MEQWLKDHLRFVLGEAESHIELRDNGIRVSAGPLHYTIHWATIGALVRRHVHPAQFRSVGKVLAEVGRYVTDMVGVPPGGSAMGNSR